MIPMLQCQAVGRFFHSLTESLAISSGGLLCTDNFRDFIAAWLDTSQRS